MYSLKSSAKEQHQESHFSVCMMAREHSIWKESREWVLHTDRSCGGSHSGKMMNSGTQVNHEADDVDRGGGRRAGTVQSLPPNMNSPSPGSFHPLDE
jgi:hypothetical protein